MNIERTWIQNQPPEQDELLNIAFQGEAGAHTFVIGCKTASGSSVALSGTVTGVYLGQNNVTVPLTGSIIDGKAVVTLDNNCYAIPGKFIVSIYVEENGVRPCVYCGIGYMFRTQTTTVPTGTLPSVSEIAAEADRAETAADNAETYATNAETSASNAESSAQAAAASAASIPEFAFDVLLDWYVEEHSGQVLPFAKINSLSLTGTGLAEGIVFDPDTTTYTVSQTFATKGSLNISNIVLNNPTSHIRWSWSRRSGNATASVSGNDQYGAIMITHGTSSTGSIQLKALITDSVTGLSQTYTFITNFSKS